MKPKHFYYSCLLLLCSCSYSSSDYADDLGGGYQFISESNAMQFITGPNDTTGKGLIPCTVEAFSFDGTYIIAKQKENLDCMEKELSALPFCYWIIDKKKRKIFGPLDSTAFIKKRLELKIPYSLSIKN